MTKSHKRSYHKHVISIFALLTAALIIPNLFSSGGCVSKSTRPCYDKITNKKTNELNLNRGKSSYESCLKNAAPNDYGEQVQKTSLCTEEKFTYCYDGTSNTFVRKFEGECKIVPTTSPTPTPTPITQPITQPQEVSARWAFPQTIKDYDLLGRSVHFKYSDISGIKTLRLYEKRPGDSTFRQVAEFTNLSSIDCSTTYAYTTYWVLIKAWDVQNGTCGLTGGWDVYPLVPGTNSIEQLPASGYSVGEYSYYFTTVDSAGTEGTPSMRGSQFFLQPLTILSPTEQQSPTSSTPLLQWTTVSGWPVGSTASYHVFIADEASKNDGQSPLWSTTVFGSDSTTYQGPVLDTAKRYIGHIYGYLNTGTAQYVSLNSSTSLFWVQQ